MKHTTETRKFNNATINYNNRDKWEQKNYLSFIRNPKFSCAWMLGQISLLTKPVEEEIVQLVKAHGKPLLFSKSCFTQKDLEDRQSRGELKNFRIVATTQSWHDDYPVSILICEVE